MPKNKVNDLITDQEMAFARLVLSGTHTDRSAAQAAGLNPDTAAYTKAKPRVREYMIEHRAALHQQLLEQQADLSRHAVEEQRRQNLRREQVLDRLWEIAKLAPEITRGSITGQVKAISMIVAIEGLIPDRRANSSKKETAPPLHEPDIYPAAWLRKQHGQAIDPQPDPALEQEENEPGLADPEPALNSVGDAPPPSGTASSARFKPTPSAFANSSSSPGTSWAPGAFDSAPDTRTPFWMNRTSSGRRR